MPKRVGAEGPYRPQVVTPQEVIAHTQVTRLRDVTPTMWRSGIAAWLGWLFDGMDGTLYTQVAAIFVMQLLGLHDTKDPSVGRHASWIQAAFLVGWAVGGAFFGHLGDRLGRARTISLTILTYALFTGLSAFATQWWHLLIFRFLAALGIGGEWAAGSSLVSETWPKTWRPWLSAILQSAYQCGYLIAAFAGLYFAGKPDSLRYIFLIGALPALIVFWIRRAVPEPAVWTDASQRERHPAVADLFQGEVLRTTVLTLLLCSAALTTVWALIFWFPQQLRNLPDLQALAPATRESFVQKASIFMILCGLAGNFFAAFVARRFGYRAAAVVMFAGSFLSMAATYGVPRGHEEMLLWMPWAHFFVQGIFGLFPLYIPPLFPVLLRATGAGFCYNFGRIIAAAGTVVFGLYSKVGDFRQALFYVSFLYVPAIVIAFVIPEPRAEEDTVGIGGLPPE